MPIGPKKKHKTSIKKLVRMNSDIDYPYISEVFFLRGRAIESLSTTAKHNVRQQIYDQKLSLPECMAKFEEHWQRSFDLFFDHSSAKQNSYSKIQKMITLAVKHELFNDHLQFIESFFPNIIKENLNLPVSLEDGEDHALKVRIHELANEFNEIIDIGILKDNGFEHDLVINLASCFWLCDYYFATKTGSKAIINPSPKIRSISILLLFNFYSKLLYNKSVLYDLSSIIDEFRAKVLEKFPNEIDTPETREQFFQKVKQTFEERPQETIPDLPAKAPKLYKDRQKDPKLGRKLNALEFLEDVYGDWLNGQGGLYRGHIRVWDKPLYEGLYKIRKSIPNFDELLPISEVQFDNLNKTPAEILEKQRDQAKQRKQRYLKK